MNAPILHAVAGPNGAGKTTYVERVLLSRTRWPFINADNLAREKWPEAPAEHAYEAAAAAADLRQRAIATRSSFIAETVFSHESKLDLLTTARRAGYLTRLHVVMIPMELAVERVAVRVRLGGHDVPDRKIRRRYERLWVLVGRGIEIVDAAIVLDNSSVRHPFRPVARFRRGIPLGPADWPDWTPRELRGE